MSKNLIISSALGLLVAALMMSVAWQHNSQGEIHSDGVIDWNYWLLIGFSWFLPVFIISGLFGWLIVRLLRQDPTKNRSAEQGSAHQSTTAP